MVSTRSVSQEGLVDERASDQTVEWLRTARVALPTFAQLADPQLIPAEVREAFVGIGPDDAASAEPVPGPLVQRREPDRPRRVPEHLVLPRS